MPAYGRNEIQNEIHREITLQRIEAKYMRGLAIIGEAIQEILEARPEYTTSEIVEDLQFSLTRMRNFAMDAQSIRNNS